MPALAFASVKSRSSLPVLIFLGTLLVQAAWILAVSPFRGIDEFDHAYRAAAVARGEWVAEGTPKHGRGGLVTVPADIVSAAHAQCAALKYTKHDNCSPAEELANGEVRVASGASRYNPVFYWVVGSAARPFHGAAALYVMRAVSALLCALGLAVAAWCVSRRCRTRWPLTGLLLAVTPVFAYSTVLPAPNGLEMVAGLVLWCALLALDGQRRRGDGWVIAWAVAASLCLVTLRSLGPVFAVLIVLCILVARRRSVGAIWWAHARGLVTGVGLTVLATMASVWWILAQAPLGTPDGDFSDVPYSAVLTVLPLGILQTVAAFPTRGEPAPAVVYVVYLALVFGILFVALKRSRCGVRQGLVLGLVLSQLVPLVLTLAGLRSVGPVWQGRYGLPFVAGLTVLAGIALDRAGAGRLTRRVAAPLAVAYIVAQTTGIGFVLHRELGNPVSTGDPGWLQPSTLVVVLLGIVGWALVAVTVLWGSPVIDRKSAVSPGLRGPTERVRRQPVHRAVVPATHRRRQQRDGVEP